jgi:hypothetical protein
MREFVRHRVMCRGVSSAAGAGAAADVVGESPIRGCTESPTGGGAVQQWSYQINARKLSGAETSFLSDRCHFYRPRVSSPW